MQILKGHTTPETAYIVEDYPYGFRLRCRIRYWLDCHPKKGARLISQTTNPKRGDTWNKPKASTYCVFGGAMFLDDAGHVQWSGAHEYQSFKEIVQWACTYGAGVPDMLKPKLSAWIKTKAKFEQAKADGKVGMNISTTEGGVTSVKHEILEADKDQPSVDEIGAALDNLRVL